MFWNPQDKLNNFANGQLRPPGPLKRSKSRKTKKIKIICTFLKFLPRKNFYLRFKLKMNNANSIIDPRQDFGRWKIENWSSESWSVQLWKLHIFFWIFLSQFEVIKWSYRLIWAKANFLNSSQEFQKWSYVFLTIIFYHFDWNFGNQTQKNLVNLKFFKFHVSVHILKYEMKGRQINKK